MSELTVHVCKASDMGDEPPQGAILRAMTDEDAAWNRKADAISKVYRKEVERVAGPGATKLKVGLARIDVQKFPQGPNRNFLSSGWIDPGGWLIATFSLFGETLKHDTWMSICPMELQSHVNPIKWAEGRVLVLGLGMGYYLREIARKRSVTEIVVIERELDAIRLFTRLFGNLPKVRLVRGNAFVIHDHSEYDFAYADIWREIDDAKPDMPKIVNRFKAKRWAYWGMERHVVDGARDKKVTSFPSLLTGVSCPVDDGQTRDIAALILKLIPEKKA